MRSQRVPATCGDCRLCHDLDAAVSAGELALSNGDDAAAEKAFERQAELERTMIGYHGSGVHCAAAKLRAALRAARIEAGDEELDFAWQLVQSALTDIHGQLALAPPPPPPPPPITASPANLHAIAA